uniref:Uncharacterized protein LOC114340718 n=1 Tax=Diabrotica virgifera virgifera TaxID=50390 RepID=A0A6P7GCZ5_DIAVI
MVNLALQYLRLATRRNNLKLDIWFIQQCLKFKVFPTFSIVRTSKNVPPNIRTSLQIKLMKKEICSHYSKLNYINCKLKVMYDSLLDIIGFINFNNFLTDVHDKVDASNTIKFNRVHNKLINLIRDKTVYDQAYQDRNNNKKFSDFQFHPRIKNLTDISFSTDEIKLLNYGLKYSVPKDLSTRS